MLFCLFFSPITAHAPEVKNKINIEKMSFKNTLSSVVK